MFQWLRKLLSSRKEGSTFDLYHPRQRLLYSYWDGSRIIREDPLVLYKRWMSKWSDMAVDIQVATSISKDAPENQDKVVDKILWIFQVKKYVRGEEGGITELEALQLMDHFISYTESLKKNSRLSATGPTPSPSSTPSPAAGPATSNSSASGSAASEASSARPDPSPSEPASPST